MSNLTAKRLTYWGLGLLTLWLVSEFVLLGQASFVLTASNGEVIVPALLSERFAADTGALWQNITSGGADKGIFTYYGTIDTFLFTAIPGWMAHAVRILTVYGAAVVGAYALSRKALGLSRPASLFVSAAFSVSIRPLMLSASIAYLPAVLLVLLYVLGEKKRIIGWIFLAAVLYVYADTTYFSQLIPWSMVIIVFWFVFVDTRTIITDWAIILCACLILVLLRLEDFSALFANAPLSYIGLARTTPDFTDVLVSSFTRPYFLASPAYAAFLALFVYSLIRIGVLNDARDRKKLWLIGLVLLIGLFLYPIGVGVQILAEKFLWFLEGYRMSYVVRVPSTILPFAAGFGIDALIRDAKTFRDRGDNRIGLWACQLGIALAISVVAFISLKSKYSSLYGWVTNGSYAHNFESPVIKKFAESIRARRAPVRVESFQIIPNYLHAYGIETAGGYQALHSKRYYKYWAKMVEPWASSIGPESRFYSQYSKRRENMEENLAFRDDRLWLFPDNYQPEWRLSKLYNLNFLSLANVGYILARERLTDPSLESIREMARPWSSHTKREQTRINIKANFAGREHLYIYRNREVFPRFFSVKRISSFKDGEAVLNAMANASIGELRSAVFVEKGSLPPGLSAEKEYGSAEIQIDHYSSDEIRLTITSGQPTVLIATNSFSPYWVSEVDGVKTPIFPAYHTFWGVALPDTARSVIFRYEPPYL